MTSTQEEIIDCLKRQLLTPDKISFIIDDIRGRYAVTYVLLLIKYLNLDINVLIKSLSSEVEVEEFERILKMKAFL